MPDTKITALTAITTVDPAVDVLPIVDVSDTTMAASGTTKKITSNQILGAGGTATLASATITGDLTVDTSTLKVDSTNNRVGIGTATPTAAFDILGAFGTATAAAVFRNNSSPNNSNIVESQYFLSNNNGGLECAAKFGVLNQAATGNNYGTFYWQIANAGSPTEAMRLNSTGLGVGVTPAAKLHVQGASAQAIFSVATATDARHEYYRNSVLEGLIGWDANTMKVGAYQSSGKLELWSGGSAKATLDSSGNVGVGVTPSGSGGCLQLKSGITFPATQVASSDANTLDDYEEGTFTATLKGGTADPTTPVTTTGRYTKIGRLVSIQLYFNNVNTTGASGSISVSGLPFSSASSIYNSGSAVSGDMATFTGTLGCWLSPSSSTIDLLSSVSNGSITGATHNAGASRYLAININYTV